MSGHLAHPSIGRILFVDQDITMREIMASVLINDRFQVVTMPSAEKGLEQLEAGDPFEIVISGYTLPGMNGLWFLHQVTELHPNSVRILMSGGNADSSEVNQAIRDGYISRYVSKPFRYDTFREDLKNDLATIMAEEIPLDDKAS
jgi:DNA-binding NtrC family response regulator